MRTVPDALRSLRLYVSQALGDTWEVRLADDAGGFTFPFAIVDVVPTTVYEGPAHFIDITQPFAISCYPELAGTATEAKLAALAIQETLAGAFRYLGVGLGAPCRIPLYDCDGVLLTEPIHKRNEHDYMRVVDFSVGLLPDPEEQWRFAVTADVRCTWRRTGRVAYGSEVVTEVRAGIDLNE